MPKRYGILILLVVSILIGISVSMAAENKAAYVGIGYSINSDQNLAVKEALGLVKQQLGKKKPDFAILFSTVGYDSELLLQQVRKELGSGTKIYGGTSCLAVFSSCGFHLGEKGSLAIQAISSDKIKFGVGGADLDKLSPEEAGRLAILEAMRNAGKKGVKPNVILMTAAPGHEESILKGISNVVGSDVAVMGGSSGDNTIEGKWYQFANDKFYKNGVCLTAIYTNLKFGIGYESGYEKTIKAGRVTKAEGRTIFEIDNKPAAEVYNEWTGGKLSEVLKTGGNILSQSAYTPLTKIVRSKENPESNYFLLSVHPAFINLPEKSVTVFTDIHNGDEVTITQGNEQILLNRAATTPRLALTFSEIAPEDVLFGIYTYCAGTMLAIPAEKRKELSSLAASALGGKPFVGNFGFGEQGCIFGIGNLHGNLVSSVIVFSANEK